MGKIYQGSKPCPGCERAGSESPRSRAERVCWECAKLLRLGLGVREQAESFSSIRLTKYTMRGFYITDLTKNEAIESQKYQEGLSYIADYDAEFGTGGSSRDLMEKFEAFVKTLDEGAKESYDYKINQKEADYTPVFSIRTETALALLCLLEVFREYADRRQKEGYREGQQLLMRLCNGSLTIDDFNRQAVGECGNRTASD